VHLLATATNGSRCYLAHVGTKRNVRGKLVLDARWDDDPSMSRSMSYENALIVKRRMLAEHNVTVNFSHSAGDTAQLID
jgi:hypothetical protein